jgi:cell wall-associated NlpC family hydrolase
MMALMHKWILVLALALLPVMAFADAMANPSLELDTAASAPEKQEHSASLIDYALSLVGVNYKYGGLSPETGMDCSGFVSYVFLHAVGLELPHNAFAISREGRKISRNELKPGDLVFFHTLRRAFSHVGIYLGDNLFVHSASSKTGQVEISDMQDSYWSKRFNGARRLALPSPSSATPVE